MILKNKKATSIVEAMIVVLVITMGIIGMFKIYSQSIKLAVATENRISAIQIAREGIEAIESIRGSNWILYSSDYRNCWNSLNYDPSCINTTTIVPDIKHNNSFILKNDSNNRWVLTVKPSIGSNYEVPAYRNNFVVRKDANGFYTQSGGTDFNPLFTREVKIEYIDTNGGPTNSNDEKMIVTSLVQWRDYASSSPHKVELQTILTNWKK